MLIAARAIGILSLIICNWLAMKATDETLIRNNSKICNL